MCWRVPKRACWISAAAPAIWCARCNGARPAGAVMGSDFCHPMLVAARAKVGAGPLFEADALRLPLADARSI
jgi:ubiquinone/menaquinone biosynthesis C-methylase UbiE